jgi:hypothetical protein
MRIIPPNSTQECSGTSGFTLHYESDQGALDRLYAG